MYDPNDDDMRAEGEGLREDEYQERRAEARRALGPEYEEEADELPLCVSCEAAEATMERADGAYVCASCYADAADYAYDREQERARGERP